MYFYRKKRKSGSSLQLLESYRDVCGRARNRVVVSLGSTEVPADLWREVADTVECRLYGQQQLLPKSEEVKELVEHITGRICSEGRWQPTADKMHTWETCTDGDVSVAASRRADRVLVDRVSHTRTTTLGAELLGLHAWKKLGIDDLLTDLGFTRRQQLAACVSVLNRLVDPVSEYGLLQWVPTSSIGDLLGEDIPANDDQYYRVSDKLLENQRKIEHHLRSTIALQFGFQRTLILYDLTNTHFEGICNSNDKARRGNNKQKRNDCPQLVVAICFDEYGFVLFHKTFAGNTHDGVTLEDMVLALEEEADMAADLPADRKPVWIMDGGIATEKNVTYLEERGYRYLVNRTRRSRGKYHEHFAQIEQFAPINSRRPDQSKVLARRIPDPNSKQRELLLCRSDQRREKELAIISRAEERFLNELNELRQRVTTGKLVDPEKINRAIGKLNKSHQRVFRHYTVELDDKSQLTWSRKEASYDKETDLSGCYVLQTNTTDIYTNDELWHLYICLTTAESGFKALKSDLGLRPVFHQNETRCDAHIFITILAYQLLRFLTYSLSLKGDKRSWQTLRRVLQTHCYSTLLLPTADRALHQIRKPGLAEECHRKIYRALSIDLRKLPRSTKVGLEANAAL